MSIDELSALAEAFERIVITGGEPLAQDVGPLVDALAPRRHVTIETSGTIFADLPGVALFSISPKVGTSGYRPKPLVLRRFCASAPGRLQFKFVIGDDRDLAQAYDCMASIQDAMQPSAPVILQPESGRAGRGQSYHAFMRALAENVVADDRWRSFDVRVLPQLHYLLWGGEPGR